jgi:hypothetical protein
MASFTRAMVAAEIRPLPDNTSDTVVTDTPAAAATSLMVILLIRLLN